MLGLLNQHSMAMLACVARSFRDHVRGVRLRKRTLVLAPGDLMLLRSSLCCVVAVVQASICKIWKPLAGLDVQVWSRCAGMSTAAVRGMVSAFPHAVHLDAHRWA